jgi:hypothetical protein
MSEKNSFHSQSGQAGVLCFVVIFLLHFHLSLKATLLEQSLEFHKSRQQKDLGSFFGGELGLTSAQVV